MAFPFGGADFHLLLCSRCKLGAWSEAHLKFNSFLQPVRLSSPHSGAAGCSVSFGKQYFYMRQGNVKVHYNELLLSIPFLGLNDVSLTSTVQFKDWLIKCLADSYLICFFVACTWQVNPFVLVSIRMALTEFPYFSIITLLTLTVISILLLCFFFYILTLLDLVFHWKDTKFL